MVASSRKAAASSRSSAPRTSRRPLPPPPASVQRPASSLGWSSEYNFIRRMRVSQSSGIGTLRSEMTANSGDGIPRSPMLRDDHAVEHLVAREAARVRRNHTEVLVVRRPLEDFPDRAVEDHALLLGEGVEVDLVLERAKRRDERRMDDLPVGVVLHELRSHLV